MDYDGLILGAGHNALVLQAYLCRAGLKVACIERRAVGGGGLTTEEHSPGFLHNTHSFYHRALTQMPWYRELELESRGARYIEPELNVALLTRDGEALEWWTDFEKTCGSIARFSSRDAATARRWRAAPRNPGRARHENPSPSSWISSRASITRSSVSSRASILTR